MPDQFAKKLQKGEVLRVNLVITNNFWYPRVHDQSYSRKLFQAIN